MNSIVYNNDLVTDPSDTVFSIIRKLQQGHKAKFKDAIDEEYSLAESDGEGDGAFNAYLVGAHSKRLLTVDYQLLVEATGYTKPKKIDEHFEQYGIENDTLLVVLTFVRSDEADQFHVTD